MDEPGSKVPIAIVTDSTSDLPRDILERYAITSVPLNVTIDGQTWLDGEMSQHEFFERMAAARALPTTSQPSAGAFVETYTEVLKRASHIVSMHISSDLSGTLASAHAAAERFAGKVSVFDSRNLSWGLGFQVIEAAKASLGGAPLDAVLEAAAGARDRVRMLVGVDKLDNLVKGGRVGKVAGFLGGVLNLKVTFTVTNGVFEPVGRIRGTKAALAHTLDWIGKGIEDPSSAAFAVMHANVPERAKWLGEEVAKRYGASEIHVVEVGSVISAHTGNGWGIAVLPKG